MIAQLRMFSGLQCLIMGRDLKLAEANCLEWDLNKTAFRMQALWFHQQTRKPPVNITRQAARNDQPKLTNNTKYSTFSKYYVIKVEMP